MFTFVLFFLVSLALYANVDDKSVTQFIVGLSALVLVRFSILFYFHCQRKKI